MKKVLFALKDMNIGGVEKSLLSLLNEIDSKEYDVTVLLLRRYGGFLEQIPSWVNIIYLDEYSNVESLVNNPPLSEIKQILHKGKYIKGISLLIGYILYKITNDISFYYDKVFKDIPKLNEKYDIAISYTSIIEYLTYYINNKINADKKIGWIHFDVNKLNINVKSMYSLHKNFDKIYIVSQESFDHFVLKFPNLKDKCELKYNVISKNYIMKLADEQIDEMNYDGMKIVTLGRLSKEKGQDMIPQIARQLVDQTIKFKWYLIGQGNLEKELRNSIEQLNLQNYIILLGSKINPYPYLKKADIYVQTSRYEGYCISLAEARMFNLPIVTTDFTGAKEQIKNGVTGSIVQCKIEELSNEIISIVTNKEIREMYRENLKKIRERIG